MVHDTLCAAKKLDVVLSYQLPTAHQLAMDLQFLRALHWFHARDALIAAQLAKMLIFAVALASKPSTRHAAALQVIGCNQEPTAKSWPCLQCLGCCQMHQSKTYIRLCAP